MQNIQEIFDQIQDLKKSSKDIAREYRDTLAQTDGYAEVTEELKTLREKKKAYESVAKAKMGARYDQFEKSKSDIENLNQMMTDVAMATLMKGESISLKDKYNVEYEPSYKITFRKVG